MPPKPCLAIALGLLLATLGCVPLTGPRLPAATIATQPAPEATATPVAVATPTAEPAPAVETCEPGQTPDFAFGFATLKQRLGDRMGEPLTCERPGPNGDALQQTTTGMARYSKSTNTPSFTAGDEHWAVTSSGLLHWKGRALDPPDDAEAVGGDSTAVNHPAPTAAQQPVAGPTPLPYADAITLPTDGAVQIEPGFPDWTQKALALLREYDRRNGTVLVPAIVRAGVSVRNLGGADGAWGLFIPSSHRIVLDESLARESPQAIAPVLGHEADHARDTFQYGPPRSDAACYTFEITAFALEARIWASVYGPSGKSDPSTALEEEENLILSTSRTDAGKLIGAIKTNYQSECG